MDNLVHGLFVTVIGMFTVFFGLALLIFCIWLLRYFAKEKRSPYASSIADSSTEAPEVESATESMAVQAGEADELIAVLTAAISALWEGEQQGFMVRRVHRIHAGPAWEKAGREEQIYSRI